MGNDRTMNEQTIVRPKELTQNIEEATYDFSKMGKQSSYEKTLKSITLLRTKSIKKNKLEEAKDKYNRAKKALDEGRISLVRLNADAYQDIHHYQKVMAEFDQIDEVSDESIWEYDEEWASSDEEEADDEDIEYDLEEDDEIEEHEVEDSESEEFVEQEYGSEEYGSEDDEETIKEKTISKKSPGKNSSDQFVMPSLRKKISLKRPQDIQKNLEETKLKKEKELQKKKEEEAKIIRVPV